MPQPLLVMEHRNGNQQVFRLLGATPIQLGNDLNVTGETPTTGDNFMLTNRVIQFQGEVYAVGTDGVYKFNRGPGNFPSGAPQGDWSNLAIDDALPFTNPSTGSANIWRTGSFYSVLSSGPTIFGVYNTDTATANWRGFSLNGTTGIWSETADTVLSYLADTTGRPCHRSIVYRNVLYFPKESSTGDLETLTFDPGSLSLGTFITTGINAPAGASMSMCIFNDRFFALARNNTTTNAAIYELSGGNFVHLFDIATSALDISQEGKHCLFLNEDGTKMIALFNDQTGVNPGWRAVEITDTVTVIAEGADVTTATIPAGIRFGVATEPVTARFQVFYDQETTAGSYRVLLYYSSTGGSATTFTQYFWADNATQLASEDVGATASFALPENAGPPGGGERIFTSGELDIQIVDRIPDLAGETIRFKCYGAPGIADKNVELRFNTQNEVPTTLAALTGTPSVISGGAAAPSINLGLKRLTGVEADGVSVYETIWDIGTDAVVAGQRAQLVPRIFI